MARTKTTSQSSSGAVAAVRRGAPVTRAVKLGDGVALGREATPRERAAKALGVPAPVLSEDRDVHANNDAIRRSARTPPARKVLPLALLVMAISAGLNSSGSIL